MSTTHSINSVSSLKQVKYIKVNKVLGVITASLVMLSGASLPAMAQSTIPTNQAISHYSVKLNSLNSSGVNGIAKLTLKGNQLKVDIEATGLVIGEPHAQHIHGFLEPGHAVCPTLAADVNKDNNISVDEGAPAYGPIKLNLTSPQTAFGPNNATVNGVKLFAPFAGVPNPKDFPIPTQKGIASHSGVVNFSHTYIFDPKNPLAEDGFNSLKPLTDQHIVLHGDLVKNTDAKSSFPFMYDALQPVACGEIMATDNNSNSSTISNGKAIDKVNAALTQFDKVAEPATSAFESSLIEDENSLQNITDGSDAVSAFFDGTDRASMDYSNRVNEAKNQFRDDVNSGMSYDQARNTFIEKLKFAKLDYFNGLEAEKKNLTNNLNRDGQSTANDQFIASFNTELSLFSNELEKAKNQV